MLHDPTLHAPLPLHADSTALKEALRTVWALEDALLGALDDETLRLAPDPLRRPLLFYLGHSAAFFINKLRMAGLRASGLDARLDLLLAKGVDPALAEDLDSPRWPHPREVRAYRDRVFGEVMALLDGFQADPHSPVGPDDPMWSVWMALEHSRIHIETSSVLVRQLPAALTVRPGWWRDAETCGAPRENTTRHIPAGRVRLGRPADPTTCPHFGWDNEYGALELDVAPFTVTRDLISNQAFLAFVEADGYTCSEWWSDEGWSWRAAHEVTHPRFWHQQSDGTWRYRAMFDERPMPLDWPVEVSCHEAEAFCRWRGDGWRLPSEAEHHRIAAHTTDTHGDVFDRGWNLALATGSPSPVGQTGVEDGCSDVWGNVWQWLRDDFQLLPGFAPHYLYEDFSAPYVDAAHAAMIGGSWISTGGSASRWYRLWFRRHFYQHAGFRMTRADETTSEGASHA